MYCTSIKIQNYRDYGMGRICVNSDNIGPALIKLILCSVLLDPLGSKLLYAKMSTWCLALYSMFKSEMLV